MESRFILRTYLSDQTSNRYKKIELGTNVDKFTVVTTHVDSKVFKINLGVHPQTFHGKAWPRISLQHNDCLLP